MALTFSLNAATLQPTISKTIFEKFNLQVDFSNVTTPSSISLVGVTAIDQTLRGADATSIIVSGSPAPSITSLTNYVVFQIQGGTANHTYVVAVKVARTDTGEQFEADIPLSVTAN
ncbi:MAG: hypothetical protein KGL39_26170 [Patescibacteria group bacterium]|nr:hypothetical protein [Patescibacteria group bacterium]